jgi:cytochrome P460
MRARAEEGVMIYRRAVALAAVAVVLGIGSTLLAQDQPPTVPRYDPVNHNLLLPVGFENWVFVGSNLGLAYRSELEATTAKEAARADKPVFHNIYINPEAYAHFRATRQFPEPTILVMEQFAAADKEPQGILSAGVYNGERIGIEVSVKNSARPDGSKTPWAYYDFVDRSDPNKVLPPLRQAAAQPDTNCFNCHREHGSIDHVWVQFYPTLRKLLPERR